MRSPLTMTQQDDADHPNRDHDHDHPNGQGKGNGYVNDAPSDFWNTEVQVLAQPEETKIDLIEARPAFKEQLVLVAGAASFWD